MATTGPFAFTKALMNYLSEQTGIKHTGDELDDLQEPKLIGDVLVLPKDSFRWLPHENTHKKGDAMILSSICLLPHGGAAIRAETGRRVSSLSLKVSTRPLVGCNEFNDF